MKASRPICAIQPFPGLLPHSLSISLHTRARARARLSRFRMPARSLGSPCYQCAFVREPLSCFKLKSVLFILFSSLTRTEVLNVMSQMVQSSLLHYCKIHRAMGCFMFIGCALVYLELLQTSRIRKAFIHFIMSV